MTLVWFADVAHKDKYLLWVVNWIQERTNEYNGVEIQSED